MCFFFFQAEDGIRDIGVTGVQTCALPICVKTLSALGPFARWREWDAYPIIHHFAFTGHGLRVLVERAGFTVLELKNRSEERRVGKGCRSWSTAARWLHKLVTLLRFE